MNTSGKAQTDAPEKITFRAPNAEDGKAVHKLVVESDFLDNNSLYCYLLICAHFSETSVIAELDGEFAGFITAYIPPLQQDVLFIWQVAVDRKAQKRGLAKSMLDYLLLKSRARDVSYLETTVTKDNIASSTLFQSTAKKYQANLDESVYFDKDRHFSGQHDSEYLLRIGPLVRPESP